LARAFTTRIYEATAKYPRKEDYGLTAQTNEAVNSISFNIAEGAAKSNRAFDYHLQIALGSAYEVVAASFLAVIERTLRSRSNPSFTTKPNGSVKL
jgi:four helix bundle protein